MKKVLSVLTLIILSSLCLKATSTENKNYITGKLIDINVEKYLETSYVNNSSTNISQETEIKKKKINTEINKNRFETLNPVTSVKNIYYFEIATDTYRYLSSFTPIWGSETDTNWVIGGPIQIRLNDDNNRLYLKRPNGKELKTKIIKVSLIDALK